MLKKLWTRKKVRGKSLIEDVLLLEKEDRRLLSNVQDQKGERSTSDRRGKKEQDGIFKISDFIEEKKKGIRYHVSYQVLVWWKDKKGKRQKMTCEGVDISMTGILLKFKSKEEFDKLEGVDKIHLSFEITPGSMPEGYEMKVRNVGFIRRNIESEEGTVYCGIEFKKSLTEYARKRKDRYMLFISSLLLLFIVLVIVL